MNKLPHISAGQEVREYLNRWWELQSKLGCGIIYLVQRLSQPLPRIGKLKSLLITWSILSCCLFIWCVIFPLIWIWTRRHGWKFKNDKASKRMNVRYLFFFLFSFYFYLFLSKFYSFTFGYISAYDSKFGKQP